MMINFINTKIYIIRNYTKIIKGAGNMRTIQKKSLIVSCQALENEPLYGAETMAKMALAAKAGGAKGIRANSPEDIKAIRSVVDLPIIGLWKSKEPNFEVYITPKYKHAEKVLKAGADYVAIDCTDRDRPEKLEEIFKKIRYNFPDKKIVSDISSVSDFEKISNLEPDFISTTMSGYTSYSQNRSRPDLELISELVEITDIPVLAEGNYKNGKEAIKAVKNGAYAVVIGSAITRPQQITESIWNEMLKEFAS